MFKKRWHMQKNPHIFRIYANKKRPIAHMRPHYPHMRKVRGNSIRKNCYTCYNIACISIVLLHLLINIMLDLVFKRTTSWVSPRRTQSSSKPNKVNFSSCPDKYFVPSPSPALKGQTDAKKLMDEYIT